MTASAFRRSTRINKDNVKSLKLAYAVRSAAAPATSSSRRRRSPRTAFSTSSIPGAWSTRSTPRSGDAGRIVWRMDPKQEKPDANRGAALWGNLVISVANTRRASSPPTRTPARSSGKPTVDGQPEVPLTAAPLADQGQDHRRRGRRRPRRARLDRRRSMPRPASALWRKYTIPAPGEPGSETWKDKNNAWQTGGGAVWVTGTYDPATNQTIWGTGNPVPMFDPTYRPGDNLFTNSVISWDPDNGKMNWYFQYTPGDMWDYDEVGTHILIDGAVNGQPRKLITHSARNGFLYTMERNNGADRAGQALHGQINWTKGIDQKTGKPVDYDPNKTSRPIRAWPIRPRTSRIKKFARRSLGGNNFWPSSYSPKTKLLYIPALTACVDVTIDQPKTAARPEAGTAAPTSGERYESNLTAADPLTGEIKKIVHLPYPNYSGTLATAGGLIFHRLIDGTVAAYDDTTLEELWKINVGSGFTAPPMTFEVNGKQYLAIVSGPSTAAQARQHAGAQGSAQRHRAVRVRAVMEWPTREPVRRLPWIVTHALSLQLGVSLPLLASHYLLDIWRLKRRFDISSERGAAGVRHQGRGFDCRGCICLSGLVSC